MKLFYATLLIACCCLTQAQTILTKIPVQDIRGKNSPLELQGLELNDSIFIAGYSNQKEPTKACWILPSGKIIKLDSPELKNRIIVALANSGDSTYFYYLEELGTNISLRAVLQNRQTGSITVSNRKISFSGSFVNIFHAGKKLYLLSIIEKKNGLQLSEIEGLEIVNQRFLNSGLQLNTNASPFSVVIENETMLPRAATFSNKIFQQGNFIYISIDENYTKEGTPAKTSISKINYLTGESEVGIIVDDSKKIFKTYIEGDYIFKIIKDRSIANICIYNLHDFTKIQTIQINKKSSISKKKGIKKDFVETIDKEPVWSALSNDSEAFVMATSIDSTNYIIRIGSHHLINKSSAGYIPILSAFPILAMASVVARVAALSLSDKVSVDQYTYLIWDGKNEPMHSAKPKSAIEAIDAYDLTLFRQKISMKYKGYVQGHSKVFGLYEESDSKHIKVLLFSNP